MKNLQVLQVETTNYCNAKCVFCPHSEIKEHGIMSVGLYQKILDEAKQLPNLKAFIPLLTGEPLCDRHIVGRVRMAREALPGVEIRFYTNGSLLTEEILDEFKKVSKFYLTISLNAWNDEQRHKLMGLDDFEHVIRMIQYAYKIGVPQQVGMVDHPDIPDFDKMAFKQYGGQLATYDNWSNLQYKYVRPRDLQPCRRALHHMPIRWDGNVPLCCFDPLCIEGNDFYGDINTQSIQEVWMSERLQAVRRIHRRKSGHILPECRHCTHDVYCETDDTIDDYFECVAKER